MGVTQGRGGCSRPASLQEGTPELPGEQAPLRESGREAHGLEKGEEGQRCQGTLEQRVFSRSADEDKAGPGLKEIGL